MATVERLWYESVFLSRHCACGTVGTPRHLHSCWNRDVNRRRTRCALLLLVALLIGGCDASNRSDQGFVVADRRLISRMFSAEKDAWLHGPSAGIRFAVDHSDPETRRLTGTNVVACEGALRGVRRREFRPLLETLSRDRTYREQFSGKVPSGRVYRVRGRVTVVAEGAEHGQSIKRDTHVTILNGRAYTFQACRNTSSNWSGWVGAVSPTSGLVAGSWTVPSGRCPPLGRTSVSIWVGLGGNSPTQDLAQVGTEIRCDGGHASRFVFSQHGQSSASRTYPSIPIAAGDAIDASVSREGNGTRAMLSVNGIKRLRGPFMTTNSPTPSAECIVERPSVGRNRLAALYAFRPVQLSHCRSSGTAHSEIANPGRWIASDIFGTHGRRLTVASVPDRKGAFEVRRT